MATNPTRLQQQAREQLAEAIYLISTAHRLDGRSSVNDLEFDEIVRRIVAVSSAFDRDQIISLAINRRAKSLGLADSAVELIMLVERDTQPSQTLMLSDDEFLGMVKSLEDELGAM